MCCIVSFWCWFKGPRVKNRVQTSSEAERGRANNGSLKVVKESLYKWKQKPWYGVDMIKKWLATQICVFASEFLQLGLQNFQNVLLWLRFSVACQCVTLCFFLWRLFLTNLFSESIYVFFSMKFLWLFRITFFVRVFVAF